jgi:hypothetical protein
MFKEGAPAVQSPSSVGSDVGRAAPTLPPPAPQDTRPGRRREERLKNQGTVYDRVVDVDVDPYPLTVSGIQI